MLVSIITVCRNAEVILDKTIESVYAQNFDDYEYIIVDGLSMDDTLKHAMEFEEKFREKGIKYRIISEKDSGIYNAMNKGSRMANGEWVIFLNAGDTFVDYFVLKKIKRYLDNPETEIVYGNTVITYRNLYKPYQSSDISSIVSDRGWTFCHQSVFTRTELLLESPYDEQYLISADRIFYLKCYLENKRFQKVDDFISVYQKGGFSEGNNEYNGLKEFIKAKYLFGLIDKAEYDKCISAVNRASFFAELRSLAPAFLKNVKNDIYMKRTGWISDLKDYTTCM